MDTVLLKQGERNARERFGGRDCGQAIDGAVWAQPSALRTLFP